MEKTTGQLRTFATLDLYLSAFLALCGIQPELEISNMKVTFKFPVSDRLYESITLFNSNCDIQILDFITAVKTLRGKMLTLRGQR